MSLAEGNLSAFELGYLSGMLDADGSIMVRLYGGKYLGVVIRYYNNNVEIINYLKSLIGDEYCSVYVSDRSGKVEYQLAVNNGGRKLLLSSTQLQMKERKREIALEILKAQENRDTERFDYLREQWEQENGRKF